MFCVYSTSLFVSLACTCCEMVHTSPSLQNDSSPSSLLLLPVLLIFTLPFVLFCSYLHLIRVTTRPGLPRTVLVSQGMPQCPSNSLKKISICPGFQLFYWLTGLKLCIFNVPLYMITSQRRKSLFFSIVL